MSKRYGLEIRRAAESDAIALAELLSAAGHTIPAADLALRLEALRQGTSAFLVALEWGPPSGLIGLHWYHSITTVRPVAQIDALLVHPAARRRGIGRLLMKAGAQIARQAGCETVRLQVEPDQDELEAFAAATGFVGGAAVVLRPLRRSGRAEADE